VLAASFDGRHASVVWPDVGEYAVYAARPQGAWAQVARGAGAAVAWAAASDTFAVLNVPKARARRAARPRDARAARAVTNVDAAEGRWAVPP